MSDSFDDIREGVKNVALSDPMVALGTGIGKLGDMAGSAVSKISSMLPKLMSSTPPRGDIALPPNAPKLLSGKDKKVVAENIRMIINSGFPEDQAIAAAMRYAKAQ